MESVSTSALLIVALVAFNAYRRGELGAWLKAKFFNQDGSEPDAGATGATKAGTLSPAAVALGAAGGAAVGAVAGGALQLPVSGPVTSVFGAQRAGRRHEGIDLAVPEGTPVHAAAAGRVLAAGVSGGYGLKVDIDNGSGLVTRYAHLSRIDVRIGQDVAGGATIGLSGNTGESTGPHVHFETRLNGIAQNPAGYLAAGLAGARVVV